MKKNKIRIPKCKMSLSGKHSDSFYRNLDTHGGGRKCFYCGFVNDLYELVDFLNRKAV